MIEILMMMIRRFDDIAGVFAAAIDAQTNIDAIRGAVQRAQKPILF
jgi:hypothetical protein